MGKRCSQIFAIGEIFKKIKKIRKKLLTRTQVFVNINLALSESATLGEVSKWS